MAGRRLPGIHAVLLWLCVATGPPIACQQDLPTVNMDEQVKTRSSTRTEDRRPVLRVAIGALISPDSTRELYYDLVSLIGDRVGRRTVFSQRRTYAEVNHLLAAKKADLAFVCSGPYVRGHDEFGLELLVVPVVAGKTTYHSYIIVPRSSATQTFAQLKGKKFAFTDQHSNSGHLVPSHLLAGMNQSPASFFGETFFTNGHDNSVRAVARGITDGAAVDSLIWDYMNATTPRVTARIRIIWTSPAYGIPPVVVAPGLPAKLKQKLAQVFLNLHEQRRAKPMLRRLKIDRFQKGDPSRYESLRKMLREIKK